MSEWNLCSEKLPTFEDQQNSYQSREMLITIPQGNKLITIAADWVRTTVRGKRVERWEWKHRICPWKPVHWMELPNPPM